MNMRGGIMRKWSSTYIDIDIDTTLVFLTKSYMGIVHFRQT